MQFTPESKRVKGIGIGAPEGPVSLDDVRSLQRSNTVLPANLFEIGSYHKRCYETFMCVISIYTVDMCNGHRP